MSSPVLLAWADARPGVGAGHAVRSFALAQAWADHGGRAMLAVDHASEAVKALCQDARVELVTIDGSAPFDQQGGDALGRQAVAFGASWVAIDSYATTREAQRSIRQRGPRVLVIDDHRIAAPYACDIVLDQNLGAEAGGMPEGAALALLGPRHALLRRSFRRRRADAERGQRVVITFGGSPSARVSALGVELANQLSHRAPVDLVMGRSDVEVPDLGPHGRVHTVVADPAELFARAALAVSAAGSTAWELCATGTPSVLISVADNQEALGEALAAAGAVCYEGAIAADCARSVVRTVETLLSDSSARAEMSRRASEIVDGLGASRVVAAMRASELTLRRAGQGDRERYFAWANDPAVRAVSFSHDPIAWDDHVRWFAARLASPTCWMFVAEDDAGTPIGQIRFDARGTTGEAVVGVALDAATRGRGLGASLIVAGVRALAAESTIERVRADVLASNEASVRAFRTAGFVPVPREERSRGDVVSFEYDVVRSNTEVRS